MIAAQLAERRRRAAEAKADAADNVEIVEDAAESFAARREAELSARKALMSKVEVAARREADSLIQRREVIRDEPEELLAAKRALSAGVASRGGVVHTCVICNSALPEKHAKRLPCGHLFHFGCINDFHRRKLEEEKRADLPCFVCEAPSNRSIAVVADEIKRKREAEAAAAKQRAAEQQAAATRRQEEVESAATGRDWRGRSMAAMRSTSQPAAGESNQDWRRTGATMRSTSQRKGGTLAALARASQSTTMRPG